MTERPGIDPQEGEMPRPEAENGSGEGNELTAASEAAAEHAMRDSGPADEDLANVRAELEVQKTEHQALHDKYLRLYSDFENFRKRTARERLELIQFAGENVLVNILPVIDDLERAIATNEQVDDIQVVRDGFKLIQQKFMHILGSQGLRPMPDAKGQPFNVDQHEAVTNAPAPTPDMKGKVIDVIANGYTLHDKVVRYAKVVVGE